MILALLLPMIVGGQKVAPSSLSAERLTSSVWELPASGYDRETFTFKKGGVVVHTCISGKQVEKSIGRWAIVKATIRLTFPIPEQPDRTVTDVVKFLPGKTRHEDALQFSKDTFAARDYFVAEQTLIGDLAVKGELFWQEKKGGPAYRLVFMSIDGEEYFFADLYPMTLADTARLKKRVYADLRARGLRPIHPVRFDVRGP